MVDEISLDLDDEGLIKLSREKQLSLSLEEMKKIRGHYQKLNRKARDTELETFAQTWSEHCCHKTFKGDIQIDGTQIKNLLKSTIVEVTKKLEAPWCFSVFEDNAGIVDFEGDFGIAFKVETHNHPSALEPFGGAATGVGGVIRDILGVWGEPIANTDVLCFGPLDHPPKAVPDGVKHPSFIHKYVTAGIGHYGNNMGIPTVNGAIYFDDTYLGNPLVYCGTVGLVRKSLYKKEARPGDALILVGGRTGRDGIHGVTFASIELSSEQERSVVQIGDPIEEEKVKRAVLNTRDQGLGTAITDLGGGGLSSAIGEMAERYGCGADVNLDSVPLKHPDMEAWEIWTSESQERMLIITRPENAEKVLTLFRDELVEAHVIGRLTENGIINLYHKQKLAGELNVSFLFNSGVKIRRRAFKKQIKHIEPIIPIGDLAEDLLDIIGMPNIASKEDVIRTYDHEVKAQTILKPLHGLDGPGDAAVIKPLSTSNQGIALSNGMNPLYGKISTYHMAACAIDEAIRNNVCVGGRRIALLDNFCWGNPEKPDRLYDLVQASLACHDIALTFKTPFISGKDSLYNESMLGPVTPSLLISALGILPDVRKAVSMDLKEEGNSIYIVGETKNELGASHYYKHKGSLGKNVPMVDAKRAAETYISVTRAIDSGCVKSCHDPSEGGIGVAAAEMAFSGGLGMELDLSRIPSESELTSGKLSFSESQSRFLIETSDDEEFRKIMNNMIFSRIGVVTASPSLDVQRKGKPIFSLSIKDLKERWQNGL